MVNKSSNIQCVFHLCDMVVKVRPLSEIKRNTEAKGSFVFRRGAKSIHADEGGGNRLFFRMMPHKRQGVRDLFNYSLDFTSVNIQKFQLTFLVVEREKYNYKKVYYPA